MPMRLSGLVSNMDTDSIIKELMKAQGLKKTKVENKLTKLQWTKDVWKDMNSKIYKFYTGPLSKLKTQGSFETKKATSSNESKVTVKAGQGAATGSHNVQVKQLASAQYSTGFKLDEAVNGNTTLSELGFKFEGFEEGPPIKKGKEVVIQINVGDKVTELYVNEDTTLNDFTKACTSAGLNASFDNTQKRLFLSSKQSGTENTFSITTKTVEISETRKNLRKALGYYESTVSGTDRFEMDKAIDTYLKLDGKTKTEEDEKNLEAAKNKLSEFMQTKVFKDLTKYYDIATTDELNDAGVKSAHKIEEEIKADGNIPEDKKQDAIDSAIAGEKAKFAKYFQDEYHKILSGDTDYEGKKTTNQYYITQEYIKANILNAGADKVTSGTIDDNCLINIGFGKLTDENNKVIAESKEVPATNSKIVYNGAELEGASNQISVNGVTFELHGITDATETVTLTVTNDIDAVYDMVRNFVKGYNELIQEMNTLYNATSSRGFNPLTDDEKGSMTDSQIEKWEQKIKDSLLRRDDKLSGVLSTMRSNMGGSVSLNGKSLSLSSFGIVTGAYTEKGLLHIAGDSEDPLYAGDADKLKKALTENPDEVMQVLNKLGDNLYQDISNKMKSTSLSSALTIYNDKEMDKLESSYKKDIATLEKKLKEMENRYYKQFSAMESAMSKLNSQSSQLSSMLGL